VEASLAAGNAEVVANTIKTLRSSKGNEWIALRPNLLQEVQAAFEAKRNESRPMVKEQLEDEEAEDKAERIRLARPSRRRTRVEREEKADREIRKARRERLFEPQLREIRDSFERD